MILEPQSRIHRLGLSIGLFATSIVMALFVTRFTWYYVGLRLVREFTISYLSPDPLQYDVGNISGWLGPGTTLVGCLILVAHMMFVYRAMQRKMLFLQRMTVYSFFFLGALFVFVPLAEQVTTQVLFPYPETYDPNYAGYHLTVLPMGVMVGLLAIWFRAQWKLTSGRKRKVEELV
ncbi:MAG: hypothetical protein CL607_09745 [Anaerolineaceae bacterium]|nr:hypothetical protein [Anaerolineaceae bacterium]